MSRNSVWLGAGALLIGWLAACGDPAPGASDDGFGQAGEGGQAGAGGGAGAGSGEAGEAGGSSVTLSLHELATAEDFSALAGEGAEVKYLLTVDGRASPAVFDGHECVFQNTRSYPYHLLFLRNSPEFTGLSSERYTDLVLRRESRRFWGGSLKLFAATPHPITERAGVLAFTLYSESSQSEMLTVDDIVEADRRLKRCLGFARDWLVFTPDGAAQLQAVRGMADELLTASVAVVEPSGLKPGLTAETYSEGEGYGYLKILRDSTLDGVGPRDLVVVDSAPNDLGIVAGLITRQPQTVASHLNLRLQEKGIPNAAVPTVFDNTVLTALADRLVHVSAKGIRVLVEPARRSEAEAFWAAARPPLGAAPADLAVETLTAIDALRSEDALAFGRKSANLGELARILPAGNRVHGFAIPFQAYAEFAEQSGIAAEVSALLADELVYTDAAHKRARLAALRTEIRGAELSPAFKEALHAAVLAAFGEDGLFTRLRFRSSTNAEDLPGLSGAGLYDSRSGCLGDDLDGDSVGPSVCLTAEQESYLSLELSRRQLELEQFPERTYLPDLIDDLERDLGEEKSAYRAVLRVWASLWNERAFDDRQYYGIEQRSVFMGIAVHPTFVGEQLESVVLTELEPEAEQPLYRVVSQAGEIGVVRPADPNAVAEILSFRRSLQNQATSVLLVQPSSLSPGGAALWSDPALEELSSLLFQVQDHFEQHVYPEIQPLSLDLEVDVTMDGRTVLKQVRPYTPR